MSRRYHHHLSRSTVHIYFQRRVIFELNDCVVKSVVTATLATGLDIRSLQNSIILSINSTIGSLTPVQISFSNAAIMPHNLPLVWCCV